ncbi:MAG: 23S rRNA (guanosine(2251)-2'-O)-methyltransferase RlmB [Propionibacteriaceae bacterium]|jgi:23S rRNA (guanosine2251-2'-O)-methyltransferase|nr:23S rRNA (guanosine(2251)-2'-O)-methyltransferase RlmB [Propionibacteriaceae bacterium]
MTKGKNTAGSGGRIRKSLEGRGPTPKAEDRVYHKAHRDKLLRERSQARRPGGPKAAANGKGAGADWVVGRNPVYEALQAGLPVRSLYVAEGIERDARLRDIFVYAAEHSLPLLQVTRAELDRMTGAAVHQGVALQLPEYKYADADDLLADALLSDATDTAALLVALDGITDPHNLGAIIRSAAAFGAHGVVIPTRRSASLTAVAWKASAGAAARTPVAKVGNLNQYIERAKKAGYTVIGLAGEAELDIATVPGTADPVLLVIGSEGDGLARLTRERCDHLARIPITSAVESLNASVAAAIALYEISRIRG